jgi:hypothetical protein
MNIRIDLKTVLAVIILISTYYGVKYTYNKGYVTGYNQAVEEAVEYFKQNCGPIVKDEAA